MPRPPFELADPIARLRRRRAALDAWVRPAARILAVRADVPSVTDRGAYVVDAAIAAERDAAPPPAVDDGQSLVDPDAIADDVSMIDVRVTDYATVQAMRRRALRPPVLSGCVVLVDARARALLLHVREGRASATYGDCLHTFGGAHAPTGDARDATLGDTIARELFEETAMRLSSAAAAIMIAEEVPTGFVQCVALGAAVSAPEIVPNGEGRVARVAFDDLPAALLSDRPRVELVARGAASTFADVRGWVPTGHLHVLAWLAAGAPIGEGATVDAFAGRSPDAVVDAVLARRVVWPEPHARASS